jgi:hypothetical protein
MSSPKNFCFTVYDATTGAPKSGVAGSMTFAVYKDSGGNNLTPPTITALGGGGYAFVPTFPTNAGIYFEINTGNVPIYITGYLRPEDFNVDSIPDILVDTGALRDDTEGSWIIQTTGPDANRMVIYDRNGNVLRKFDLKHADGTPWVPPAGANTQRVLV